MQQLYQQGRAALIAKTIAALVTGSDLLLLNVGLNETRDGIFHVMKAMGADLAVDLADRVSLALLDVYGEQLRLRRARAMARRLSRVCCVAAWLARVMSR